MTERPPVVPLTADVLWLGESFRLEAAEPGLDHVHVSVYMVRSPEGWILIDSGSFFHRDALAARIAAALDGEPVRALLLSHSDYPHSGNIDAFRREWGDFEIVASCGNAEIQGLPYATRVPIGGSLRIAGRTFRFLDPPLADRSHTSWIHDVEADVWFVADGFGSYHAREDRVRTSRDLAGGVSAEAVHAFHRDTIVWLRYADPDRMAAAFEDLFAAGPVAWVAPIHGHPIHGSDLPGYVEHLNAAVRRIVAAHAE